MIQVGLVEIQVKFEDEICGSHRDPQKITAKKSKFE